MVRNLRILLVPYVLLFGCTLEPNVSPLDPDKVYEQMHVDFIINVLDDEVGHVQLIDASHGVDQLVWECKVGDTYVEIPNTYPGDTLELVLTKRGTYVFELTGTAKTYGKSSKGDITTIYLNKSKVRSIELEKIKLPDYYIPYIKYVKINSYPALDEYGFPWDADGSGPDIAIGHFYIYDDEFINEPLVDTVYTDMTPDKLPIIIEADFNFSLMDVDIQFEMIEHNNPGENKFGDVRMLLENFLITVEDTPQEPGDVEYTNKHFSIGVEWK